MVVDLRLDPASSTVMHAIAALTLIVQLAAADVPAERTALHVDAAPADQVSIDVPAPTLDGSAARALADGPALDPGVSRLVRPYEASCFPTASALPRAEEMFRDAD